MSRPSVFMMMKTITKKSMNKEEKKKRLYIRDLRQGMNESKGLLRIDLRSPTPPLLQSSLIPCFRSSGASHTSFVLFPLPLSSTKSFIFLLYKPMKLGFAYVHQLLTEPFRVEGVVFLLCLFLVGLLLFKVIVK